MRRMLALFVVSGCGDPGPGERGDKDCEPVPVRDSCAVWLCFTAVYPNEVIWQVESGDISWDCDGADCRSALNDAAFEVCGQSLGLGDTGA